MGKTTVVCAKTDDFDISIMRSHSGIVPDPPDFGCYGNPFKFPKKEDSVKAFRKYFYERISKDQAFLKAVLRLEGKRLGCSCQSSPCHGDVYVEFFENKTNG